MEDYEGSKRSKRQVRDQTPRDESIGFVSQTFRTLVNKVKVVGSGFKNHVELKRLHVVNAKFFFYEKIIES